MSFVRELDESFGVAGDRMSVQRLLSLMDWRQVDICGQHMGIWRFYSRSHLHLCGVFPLLIGLIRKSFQSFAASLLFLHLLEELICPIESLQLDWLRELLIPCLDVQVGDDVRINRAIKKVSHGRDS